MGTQSADGVGPKALEWTSIDTYLPSYDVRSAHEVEVEAPAEVTYRAARALDISRSLPVMALFAIRGIPHFLTGKVRPSRSFTLQTALEAGFVILEESPPNFIVLGSVGRFWRPDSGMVPITADDFYGFDTSGFAKAVMTLGVRPRDKATSLLTTETRVHCTDPSARRKFLLYWRAIGPFSGLIRHLMLNEVKRTAEGE
jgi:hypothetical protein